MKKYKFTDIKSITLTKHDLLLVKKVARLMSWSKEGALSFIINYHCNCEGIKVDEKVQ